MKVSMKNLSKKQKLFLVGISIPVLIILFFFLWPSTQAPMTTPQDEHKMDMHTDYMDDGPMIKLSPLAQKLAQVEVTPVIRDFVESEIRLYGKIEYDETNVEYITAWVPGRIEKLLINFTGMEVQTGEPMVEYYSPELIVAQEELLQSLQMYRDLENTANGFAKEQSSSNLESARTKLRLWGIHEDQIQKIESTGKVEKILSISAPSSGVVIHKNALEGEYVKEGTKIYTIANLEQLWMQIEAYESDLAFLQLGQNVTFTTNAYPGRTFHGVVSFIDPFLNEKTRTASVRVNIHNKEGKLKPGMYVTATIRSFITEDGMIYAKKPKRKEAPLIIPATAPLITGKRAIVYVQNPENRGEYSLREVVLGPRAGDYYIVVKGLFEGELVVTNGNFKIDSAAQIQAKPSMMSPEGGVKPMKGH